MQTHLLEGRRLLSATVTETFPGYFEVNGDETDDAIVIVVDQEQQSVSLDGNTYSGVSFLTVFGNGGNDKIDVSAAAGPGGSIGASVEGGDGDDELALNINGAVRGDGGNDTLRLSDSFQGEVYGDDGDDRICVRGESVDAQIFGGEGNDLIDAIQNQYGVVIRGGGGDDTVYGSQHDDQIYGDDGVDILYGLGGNDTFYSRDAEMDHIFGGGGTDFAYVDDFDVPRSDVEYIIHI